MRGGAAWPVLFSVFLTKLLRTVCRNHRTACAPEVVQIEARRPARFHGERVYQPLPRLACTSTLIRLCASLQGPEKWIFFPGLLHC